MNKLREAQESRAKAIYAYKLAIIKKISPRYTKDDAYRFPTELIQEKADKRNEYIKKLLNFKDEDNQKSINEFLIKSLSWLKKQTSKENFKQVSVWLEPLGKIGVDVENVLNEL